MTHDPDVLKASREDKAKAFEWLRALALGGGKDWRMAAVAFDEWARLSNGGTIPRPEEAKPDERKCYLCGVVYHHIRHITVEEFNERVPQERSE